ncbi:MAG: glycoside hydrolase family 95-like protein, partial [bacterium]
LLFSPSYSPENNPKNNPSQACVNATMDIAVAKELLTHLIAACEELGTDAEGVTRWRALLAKMPDYLINADGAVKEWATPLLEDNYAHRHVSHLYPLFVGMPPEIGTNAALRAAFKRAADYRMEIRRKENGGEMAFGLVQLGQAVSSLREAPMSYEVVDWLANNYWYPNLVTTHNPKSLFNVDLCGGLPAIIIKMLVDSQPGWIELLPALPQQWPAGRIEGVRCRGQIEARSLAWDAERITVTLKSDIAQRVELRSPAAPHAKFVDLPQGRDVTVELVRSKR